MKQWGSPQEKETKRRINLAVWAYAYEFDHKSLAPDHTFDFESYCVNLTITTNRPDLDAWFVQNFNPCTGMWIHNHPELDKIKSLYERHYKK